VVAARGLILAAALLCAAAAPAFAETGDALLERGEVSAMKLAAVSLVLTRELMIYDETLRMRVVRVALAPSAADAALKSRAAEAARQRLGQLDRSALRTEQRKEAAQYFAFIDAAMTSGSARWPTDRPTATYQMLGRDLLARARTDYNNALARNEDPGLALAAAYRVLAWTRGAGPGSGVETPFDTTYDRVRAAMPGLPPQPAATRVPDFSEPSSAVEAAFPAPMRLPAAPLPLSASAPPPSAQIVDATVTEFFDGVCGPRDRNRTLDASRCNGRTECTVEMAHAPPDASAQCRRELIYQWSCDTDAARRSLRAVPGAAGSMVTLSCRDASPARSAAAPRP
jgi:hypothetical protein